jgi:peptide/nickel transport system substrate-binding protein
MLASCFEPARFRILAACLALVALFATRAGAEPAHGIAMHGEPALAADFAHLPHTDPDAPKGGDASFGQLGAFDSMNPFIIKGVAAAGLREHTFESLLARAPDEPFTLYGLIAESIEVPEDRSWVTFRLRPEAAFSDGTPITAKDVVFSHKVLRDHGRPNHRSYYSRVTEVETPDDRTVRFVLGDGADRELPLILGLMPILPSHLLTEESFQKTSLEPPVGSGPYRVEAIAPGSRVVYVRNPDYWGADLPINRGQHNFDRLTYEYFRDAGALFEAFKKGIVHIRTEDDPGRWAREYDALPAVRDGRILREEIALGTPAGMSALVFNTRRPIFADRRVREALTLLFDFEWLNRNLYFGLYERTRSFFARSELASAGHEADATESALLAPFAAEIDPRVMRGESLIAATDGSGRNRESMREALALLKEAGWEVRGGRLVNAQSGAPFAFEMLAATRAQERLMLTYARMLKQVGIDARIRLVDSAQYERRKQGFDFDMIQNLWPASLSPGNEQGFRFSRAAAATEGSFNYPGVDSEAVDAMIVAILAQTDRASFVSAVRALDRALLSGSYVIPLYHLPGQWLARRDFIARPDTTPLTGPQPSAWWRNPAARADAN